MPDWQTYLNTGAGLVFAVIGAFVKSVRDDHREQAQALQAFRLEVAKDYVTHGDLGDIKDSLRRIEDKLDGKADK